jgi:hypothetical protein
MEGQSEKSIPEPPPQAKGVVVPDALIKHLEEHHPYIGPNLCYLIKQRDAFGRAKYGQPLMSQDGRNGVEDARQEAGDLLQYAFKVYLSGDLTGLKALSSLTFDIHQVIQQLADSSTE